MRNLEAGAIGVCIGILAYVAIDMLPQLIRYIKSRQEEPIRVNNYHDCIRCGDVLDNSNNGILKCGRHRVHMRCFRGGKCPTCPG